jgi:hypothetical protein
MVKYSSVAAGQKKAGVAQSGTSYDTRTNARAAEATDALQNTEALQTQQDNIQKQRAELLAAHQTGTISVEDYNRRNTDLTNAAMRIDQSLKQTSGATAEGTNYLAGRQATAANSAAGAATSFTPDQQGVYNPTTKSFSTQQSSTGTYGLAGDGNIQQSAIDRIKQQHPEWTDAQIMQQVNSQDAGAASTMQNSGLGMDYDPKTGVAIPGTEGNMFRGDPRAQAEARAKAAQDAEVSGIKGYSQQTQYDAKGNAYTVTVEDPAKTQQLQDEARTANKTKGAADANYAASLNENDTNKSNPGANGAAPIKDETTPPPPNPDAFLAGLDALERQYAGTTMAPLFELYDALQKRTDEYVAGAKADMKNMESAWGKIYSDQRVGQVASAKRTYDQQTMLAEQQRDQDQLLYDRAIRDQNIKNEEDRRSLLLGNGISGGWRSSMHTARMIDAFKKAENIVADLREDKINNGTTWGNKMIEIEGNYHGNITAAYDAYNVNLLTLQDKLSERARDIDKTVFSNDTEQMKGIAALTEAWYDGVSEIASETTKTVIQISQQAIADAKDKRVELRAEQTDFRSRYQFHLGTYGNTDPTGYQALVDEAAALGTTIPSAAPETLEQKAMAMKAVSEGISTERGNTPHVVNGNNLTPITKTVLGRLPETRRPYVESNLYEALEAGDMNRWMNLAIDTGLEGLPVGLRTDYSRATFGLSNTGAAAGLLAQVENTDVYKRFSEENISSALAKGKDQPWLLALGTFQLAQGELIKDLIGVAQTDGEAGRLAEFMQQKGDTVSDLAAKLKMTQDYYQRKYDNVATQSLGLGYGQTVRNGVIVNTQSGGTAPPAQTDTYDDDPSMSEPQANTGGTSGGMFSWLMPEKAMAADYTAPREVAKATARRTGIADWVSSIGSGKETAGYDSPHVKLALSDNHMHGGLDIGGKKGDKIKPFIGGEIVDISGSNADKTGWGLSVTIRDDQGVFHKYSHLDGVAAQIKAAFERGENPTVTPDMEFAYMGNSGHVIPGKGGTGVHLDYRARKANGKWIRVEQEYQMPPDQMFANSPKKNAQS